ncbi:exo-beta-N-acetylmuramidase NamZ family protein [Mariniflexile sp.]|uniref:exo-beta-N-acetylmuramidase NamZ family protein n=1 Tax=Mariniflexile sp. TaxID=1979402 RepID=UPI004047E970
MWFNVVKNTVLFPIIFGIVYVMVSCGNFSKKDEGGRETEAGRPMAENQQQTTNTQQPTITVGANQTEGYVPLLKGKRVGVVANQTSVIFKQPDKQIATTSTKSRNDGYVHLVDSLLSLKINVVNVFAPEHGFRGTADAGEHIKDGIDTKTGVPIISLYGDNKKPKPEQLKNMDVMLFDLQDVGVRFYTYISTLHYVMEACAEANIPLIILDRPNPNGQYIDGPILEMENKSFVGMHPIPVAHGMTIGEYANMINGEKWLKNGIQCELKVIPVKNYTHQMRYSLPIKPSPNLPNDKSINLYPSLCFFEGANVSVGRGTDKQFQVFGSPFLNKTKYTYTFTPQPNEGAKWPLYQGRVCYGMDLSKVKTLNGLDLSYLIHAYQATENQSEFFNAFFTKLAGTKKLQQQIEAGVSETDIKSSWQKGLERFKATRANYLLYK